MGRAQAGGGRRSGAAEYRGARAQVCLAGGLEVNECLGESHGCWSRGNASACVDTFRGYVCQCPEGAHLKTEGLQPRTCAGCAAGRRM